MRVARQCRSRRALLAAGAAVMRLIGPSGCGSSQSANAGGDSHAAAASSTAPFEAQLTTANPCQWLAPQQVQEAIGRSLVGDPTRVSSAESLTPAADGAACLYRVASDAGDDPGLVAVEVSLGAAELEMAFGLPLGGLFGRDAAPDDPESPWDWVSGLPTGIFVARQGELGVVISLAAPSLTAAGVEPLARRVLEQIPDRPFTSSATDPAVAGSDPDPCTLLSRAEAEGVLGPLSLPPYRSRESTSLAYGAGPSCSYYTGRHRVVVITPTWHDGQLLFRMANGINEGIRNVLAAGGAVDTLEGDWDQRGAGINGVLYFLKGDRMLELQYKASATDERGAIRLANVALSRLEE